MARKRQDPPPAIVPKQFTSLEEIDQSIAKLERRIKELEVLDLRAAVYEGSGADDVARSNVRETIRQVFGTLSPEFKEHEYLDIWSGPLYLGMEADYVLQARERGRTQVIGFLRGLIGRLQEQREEVATGVAPKPTAYLDRLNLHPRILDVSRDLFMNGHPWEAVFAASKALVNYVKERSGRHDLDGAAL